MQKTLTAQFDLAEQVAFDGSTYNPLEDHKRLTSSLGKFWDLMRDQRFRTLAEITEEIKCSEAGASARFRDLRKPKFRAMFPTLACNSERVEGGLWRYQIIVPERFRK